ncbi:MAG: hypothetical protein K2F93_08570 [Muribaculaceae bacterium]|nr:hypothetical protein [Muribaculaceae bacterium]
MKKIFTAVAAMAAAGLTMEASAISYAPEVGMHALQVSDEVIDDQPDGELSWLTRSCDAFDTEGFEATHSRVLGSIVQMVEGDDGYVYLSHMATEYPVNTWTRFEREGNTLVMNGIQAIYEEDYEEYDQTLTVYLAPMELVVDDNGVGSFVVPDDCRYVFNIGEDGSLTASDPNMILGVCVHTLDEALEGNNVWIWKGFGDRDIKMEAQTATPLELPDGLEVYNWVMTDQYVNDFVKVAIDGDDFYIAGLDRSIPEAWVKGKISEGKVTFPSGQYLGADMGLFFYNYFCGADFLDETDEDGNTIRVCSYRDEAVFDYDAAERKITSVKDTGYIINSTPKQLYSLYFYEDVTVGVQHRNPEAVPAAPYDLVFSYDNEYGSTIWFQLPNTDEEGQILLVDNLYYEIYVDDEPIYFDIVDEDWNVESTTRIPYMYDDWNDFWVYDEDPRDHTVYLYLDSDPYSIGVRSIYVNENGEDICSPITYWGEEVSAVDGIGSEKKPVAVKWFDLQGRAVGADAVGIVVKVAEYADGSTVRTKMLKK